MSAMWCPRIRSPGAPSRALIAKRPPPERTSSRDPNESGPLARGGPRLFWGTEELGGLRVRRLPKDQASKPTLRDGEHGERDGIPARPHSQVPRGHDAHEPEKRAHHAQDERVLHGVAGREPRREPGAGHADHQAI